MNERALKEVLERVAAGEASVEEALELAARSPFVDLQHTRLDVHRGARCGFDEVIYAAGKKLPALIEISRAALEASGRVLMTRLPAEFAEPLKAEFADIVINDMARTAFIEREAHAPLGGTVAVVSAGTSDAPVAEEAAVCARFLGLEVRRITDVGVAGLPRLIAVLDQLRKNDVLIVVAGMEGALPGVIAGLTTAPVIAVPTSVGYGVNFGGITALCGMLMSCSPGVSVVNIDNGFGAALTAAKTVKHLTRSGRLIPT